MSKIQVKVQVIGNDSLVTQMFKEHESGFISYHPMLNDVWSKPDLVCFTGGEDVNPKLYDENPLKETRFSETRDQNDKTWYDRYKDVPKVGICRGGQFLNVMSGGAMWQHVDNHGMSHDMINLLPMEPGWAQGDMLRVTSTHHQMMIPGEEGEVIAIAMNKIQDSGIAKTYLSGSKREIPKYDTEVVYYDNTKSLCYQPHPEYLQTTTNEKYFFSLLNHFFFS